MSIEVALGGREVAAAGLGEQAQDPVVQDGKDMGQLRQAETAMVFLQAHIASMSVSYLKTCSTWGQSL